MKEDLEFGDSVFSRASQKQQKQEQKSLFRTIGRSLVTPESRKNRLIFVTKAISLAEPIAYSIFETVEGSRLAHSELVLLIDFENEQIQYLNDYLANLVLTQPLRKSFDEEARRQLKVTRLNTLTIDKRKACYVRSGFYAASMQIFLTDLLRGQATLQPRNITKIIVKLTDKVKSYYHYYGWMTTMLRIKQEKQGNKWRVPILFVCNQVHYYSFEQDLREIYRIFFCDKVVIWPFGRAEIHKRLSRYRQGRKFRQWQHSLSHSQSEREIQQILFELYAFLRRGYASKYGERGSQLDDIFYGRVDEEQSFRATRGEFKQFENVKFLFSLLDNCGKLAILNVIASFIQESKCELWFSNNKQIVELVETLTSKLKENVFYFQKREDRKVVDLKAIIFDQKRANGMFSASEAAQFSCDFEIDIRLAIKIEQNEKISQLVKIIQDARLQRKSQTNEHSKQKLEEHLASTQKSGEGEQSVQEKLMSQDLRKLQEKVGGYGISAPIRERSLLVLCNTNQAYKYVNRSLKNYLSDRSYLDYLFILRNWLKTQSPLRLTQLKRIYQKRKIKIGDDSHRADYKCPESQRINESKLILEQLLLIEIQRLQQFMFDFQLQENIINEQLKSAQSQGSIFNINEEEAKLKERFNQNLLRSDFKIIDISKIRLANQYQKGNDRLLFESASGRLNVVATNFNRRADLTHFYGLLKAVDPEIIVFYSPNTHLLRSLYLYQIEANFSSLQHLHILNYQDSYQSKGVQHQVLKEDRAFWQISQKRSQLSDYAETPFLRVKTLSMHDKVEKAVKSLNGRSLLRNQQQTSGFNLSSVEFITYKRVIIVDSRQFKSSLPSYLYHYGFQVVPMFLKTADYILSDQIAVEKKSVNTRDLHTSLRSPRLDQQLKRMNAQFKKSYLLIQFEQEKDCRKDNFSGYQFGKNYGETSQSRDLRKRLLQLIYKYEKVRLLWSTSVIQSCEYFKILKMDHPEPDLHKFYKTQAEEQPRQSKRSQQKKQSDKLDNIIQVSSSKQNE